MTINARMLITVLLFAVLTPLWAQNQRLAWDGEEYAMRYEVIIEKEEEGEYNGVLREFTEESFIEVSLLPGKYRCQIIPYDFFNQPVPVTDWVDFEVRSSFHEIITVSEIPSAAPEAASTEPEPEPEKTVEYQNRFDLYLSAAWIWFVPFHDENATVSPLGAAVRFGFVPTKRRFLNPGMELTASWRMNTLQFDCNMVQQSRFTGNGAALNVRLGAGVSLEYGDASRWAAGQYSTHANIGVSLLCLIKNNVFMETGVEYSKLFTQDLAGFIRAWMGLSCKF